jgi:N6-adenosine-specific RNA methylase IME4
MRGRPPTRKKGAYTPAERARRYRRLLKRSQPDPKTRAKQQRRAEREQELAAATARAWLLLDSLDRLFLVLYVDFPWRIEAWSRETGLNRAADNHYETWALTKIKETMLKLPAAKNCVLFMWIVSELLDEIKDICAVAGFKYRSHCIWRKTDKQPGMGHWFRFKHEILVVAVRGDMPCPAPGENWDAMIEAPWQGHSRKPEIFADLIAAYYPTAPKLEMFYRALDDPEAERIRRAKREAAGWYFWGNEAEAMQAAE